MAGGYHFRRAAAKVTAFARRRDRGYTRRMSATHRRNPWWIPRFLGRVPADIAAADLRLLGAVALALAYFNYDLAVAGQTIKFVREDFGLPQSEIGRLSAYFRLGAIPAFFAIPFADWLGRRRLFLGCVLGAAAFTGLTALAQNIEQLIALQICARVFVITGIAQSYVIIAEELPAAHRGWGAGVLGAIAAVGVAFGAALFSFIDALPFGWRSLFAAAATAVFFIQSLRGRVRETDRFVRGRDEATSGGWLLDWLRPMQELVVGYPLRTLAVVLIGGLTAAASGPIFTLASDYMLTDHGWTPGQYSLVFVGGGVLGILGNTVVGRLGDRFGRRLIGCAVFAAVTVCGRIFYSGSGWLLPLIWIPLVFAATGAGVITRNLATELFPTSARGTSTGWLILLEAVGAGTALWAVTVLTPPGSSIAPALTVVVLAALVSAGLVLLLPETAGRELEQITEPPRNPDSGGADWKLSA